MDIRSFFQPTKKKKLEKKATPDGKKRKNEEGVPPRKKRKLTPKTEKKTEEKKEQPVAHQEEKSESEIQKVTPKKSSKKKPTPKKSSKKKTPSKKKTTPKKASKKKKVAKLVEEQPSEDMEEVEEPDDGSANSHYAKYRKKKNVSKGSSYDPVEDAKWKKTDKNVPYSAIAAMFDAVSENSSRLAKIDIVANLFRSVIVLHPQELATVFYITANQIAPPYAKNMELGIGDSVIYKALQKSTGRSLKEMKAEMQKVGDLGTVAVNSRSKQGTLFKPKPLTTIKVLNALRKCAKTSGTKSNKQKENVILGLFVAAQGSEAKFLTRHLSGKSLKLGLAEQTVFAALGKACALTPPATKPLIMDLSKKMSEEQHSEMVKTYTDMVKQTFSELPNFDSVISALIEHGLNDLSKHCHLTPGIPVKAMLAKPTTGIQDILERFKECKFTLEYKYDGERSQIHLMDDGEIKLFSRNAENNTEKYPDIIEAIPSFLKEGTTSCILDCEVVAYDREEDKIRPFQALSHRKRKDVKEITIQVCLYCFDVIYLNGRSLLKENLEVRRQLMHDSFQEVRGQFHFADYKDSSDPEEITEFLNKAIQQSCEGLMVKALDKNATYEPSKRSLNWLKCKKDYLDGCGDTLDLVVLGAYWGTGKRTGTFGSYLMGCYNPEEESYQTTCKVGTGFKDEMLKIHTDFLKKNIAETQPSEYEINGFDCDVWFEPVYVWEIKCADLSISPKHTAASGIAHEEKGIGLRFPRFLRIRDDKKPKDATTADQVYDFYRNQAVVKNNS